MVVIKLRPGAAEPKNIRLYEGPPVVPTIPTTIRLYPRHATPSNIILRDPTAPVAGGAFTLTVSPATVAITGQSVALRVGRRLAVSPATVPITGQSVALRSVRRLTVSPATVPIAGQSVDLRVAYRLVVSPATVPIVGQSVSLGADRRLVVLPATVAINGQEVTLTFTPAPTGFTLTVLPATVSINGQSVNLRADRRLTVSPATVTIVGQSVSLTATHTDVDDLGMPLKDIRSALRRFLLADEAIAAIVGSNSRIYPMVLPQGQRLPSIVYNRISGLGDHHTQGPSGLARPRFQIDAWAELPDDAANLADLVQLRLDGYQGPMPGSGSPADDVQVQGVFFDTIREDYQADINMYRVSNDYLIWFEQRE